MKFSFSKNANSSHRSLIKIFTILISLVICCFQPHLVHAQGFSNPFIVINSNDGAILAAQNENARWFPASLVKLMTAYTVMDAIRKNDIQGGSPVIISKRARNMPPSKMGYKTGTKIRVDTAMKIVIVKSANDVAVALAEAVGGSVENFVKMMNKTARVIGLTNSNFVNPNGLHSPNQYSTARDMAILARRLLIDFPQYSDVFAVPAVKTAKKTYYSYNLLLERFTGANGMKTGFICASGYNMIASAKRGDGQFIAVVFGAQSQGERAIIAAKLLSNAFNEQDRIIGNLLSPVTTDQTHAVNMRSVMCSKKARDARYDPGAGQAVIKSKWLNPREKSDKVLFIKTGGVDAPAGQLYLSQISIPKGKVPVPKTRPDYEPPAPIDAPWQTNNTLRNTIGIPVSRPAS